MVKRWSKSWSPLIWSKSNQKLHLLVVWLKIPKNNRQCMYNIWHALKIQASTINYNKKQIWKNNKRARSNMKLMQTQDSLNAQTKNFWLNTRPISLKYNSHSYRVCDYHLSPLLVTLLQGHRWGSVLWIIFGCLIQKKGPWITRVKVSCVPIGPVRYQVDADSGLLNP